MSASHPRRVRVDLAAGDSFLPPWVKNAVRAALAPAVRLALALHITPNTITVIGMIVVAAAALLVGLGMILPGAALLVAGSLLDAVDGALARASGGPTRFGGFLDSTLDRVAEATLFVGVAAYFLATSAQPTAPVVLAMLALVGSFLVSYTRARAEALGYSATVGLAPRPERLVLVSAGLVLAGVGFDVGLVAALAVIGLLTFATVVQRIWHVWRQAGASTHRQQGS
jgi:CDP-diacylglycerol--glycerol-3-phosphate 3-phosphatidyltransferase